MAYQSITNQILEIISESDKIIDTIINANALIKNDNSKKQQVIEKIQDQRNVWYEKCQVILVNNELLLELEDFINYPGSAFMRLNFNQDLNTILNFMRDHKAKLIGFANNIESKQNKKVVLLTLDDFDNFKEIKKIKPVEVADFSNDSFLEDDVENAFLKKLEEPYKELDGGAETRDLFSDRVTYKNKRLATVFMFKGRGQKGELTLNQAGSKGDQLLKLAKNNAAECFIVQHTNKISPNIREALQDHILQNTRLSKVYICFIDGIDTARFLKSIEENLQVLKNKKIKPGNNRT